MAGRGAILPDSMDIISRLLRQQAAIAGFGSFALQQTDLATILAEAVRACAAGSGAAFCKVCRYRNKTNDLFIEAVSGLDEKVVGHVTTLTKTRSMHGQAFMTGEPVVCTDLRKAHGFDLPAFYAEHGTVSTADVVIKADGQFYGVLEIGDTRPNAYDQNDIEFLTGFANVLAEAIRTSERVALLQTTVLAMKSLVDDKDRLIAQKNVLAQELQHRVRNNLQLVNGMLNTQLNATADRDAQKGIKGIARRVSTLAQVYDHLLGSEMTRTTNFGSYVASLCSSLFAVQSMPDSGVTVRCIADDVLLDLDTVTALGIIVTELVTNSFDHALVDGKGSITVRVQHATGKEGSAFLRVSDTGPGFEPKAGSKRRGLGLVRRLVEQIGGTVKLDFEGGTVWTITFSCAAPLSSA